MRKVAKLGIILFAGLIMFVIAYIKYFLNYTLSLLALTNL